MNKILTSLIATAVTLSASATEPNRVIVNHANGTTSSYMVDRVTGITFATVDGPVKADITIEGVSYEGNYVCATLTPTPDCKGWKSIIMPSNEIAVYDTDVKLAAYIDANAPSVVRDFPSYGNFYVDGSFRPNVEYKFCTLGFDMYGTPCEVATATFIPEVAIVGNPEVTVAITDVTETSAQITMTPNADCSSFRYYLAEKGKLLEYYEMLGSAGIGSLEEAVEALSLESYTQETVLAPDYLNPATAYELSVVCYDANGIKSPVKTVEFKTKGGSEIPAWVDIAPTKYVLGQMPNPDNPSQIIFEPFMYFKFTPNASTARYRQEMFTKAEYEQMGKEAAVALVKRDPEPGVPDDLWFRYTEVEMCSQYDPNTEIVVIAAGKNSLGEWGEANILEYTTPSEPAQ